MLWRLALARSISPLRAGVPRPRATGTGTGAGGRYWAGTGGLPRTHDPRNTRSTDAVMPVAATCRSLPPCLPSKASLTLFPRRGFRPRGPSVRPSPRRPCRAPPGPPEVARWLPGTAPDGRSRQGVKRGEITEKVGLPGLQAAMPTMAVTVHSHAGKGELSLPNRAADAAPSSIHIPNGLGRALDDAYKGLTVQLDQLCALSAGRRCGRCPYLGTLRPSGSRRSSQLQSPHQAIACIPRPRR